MKHAHSYDAQGKQLCCTEEEKLMLEANSLIKAEKVKDSCCATDDHDSHNNHDEHADDDGHDHSIASGSSASMFFIQPLTFSLLVIAIVLDNYITQSWFTGWLCCRWYVAPIYQLGYPY